MALYLMAGELYFMGHILSHRISLSMEEKLASKLMSLTTYGLTKTTAQTGVLPLCNFIITNRGGVIGDGVLYDANVACLLQWNVCLEFEIAKQLPVCAADPNTYHDIWPA
jgi:hypothetical protein